MEGDLPEPRCYKELPVAWQRAQQTNDFQCLLRISAMQFCGAMLKRFRRGMESKLGEKERDVVKRYN